MSKWVDFSASKNQQYGKADFVALLNFREANKRFTERLAVLDNLAKTPLKTPISSPSVALATSGSPPPAPPRRPWAWLFGLGLGIAGLGFASKKIV